MFVVEFRETLSVSDGVANDNHGGEGEMVIVNDACEVAQHAAVDALVGPCQVIAGCDGCFLGVFHEQFVLDVVDDGSAEEDAHGRLAACQKVELFFFGHGRPAFPSCENDGLCAFGYGEL